MGEMAKQRSQPADLTVVGVPFYFAGMAAEYLWLRRTADRRSTSAGDYERRDTIASLTMGFASLVVPLVAPRVLGPITPRRSRFGKALVAAALGAAAATTAADMVVRRSGRGLGRAAVADRVSPGGDDRPAEARLEARLHRTERARRVASAGGVASIVLGGVALATTLASSTTPQRLWRRRILPDLGSGPVALALAIVGWDFIYYWNHRFMHECRYLWAVHVVHHSSEHYNLSTALRQPVADRSRVPCPTGSLPGGAPTGSGGHGPWGQPAVSVLDPHRGDRPYRASRGRAQLPVAPPCAPRFQLAVPRPQPREHPHRVGSPVRHLRAGGRTGGLRHHQEHRHLQPGADRVARVHQHAPRRGPVDGVGRAALARGPGPRVGARVPVQA